MLELHSARPQRSRSGHSHHGYRPRQTVRHGGHSDASPRQQFVKASEVRPLVVDVDGTLIRSDLLVELAFAELGRRPSSVWGMAKALFQGKANLKHYLCERADLDPATLPYDPRVLARIKDARASGRPVYLASASHEKLVRRIADHLGLFDGWFATDATNNLAGAAKAEKLVSVFGEGGFDYIGNDAVDLHIWAKAGHSIGIRTSPRVRRQLSAIAPGATHLQSDAAGLRTWLKLFRVHQYAKNALVALPLLVTHQFDWTSIYSVALAFIAFSLAASSVYVLNDVVDLRDDRVHRSKRHRPLASGAVPITTALACAPVLALGGLLAATMVSRQLALLLLIYLGLTTAYTFALKRMKGVDVVTLAGLYCLRIVAGAVAMTATLSPWLLASCMSLFLSLALLKRYVELLGRIDAGLPDSTSRGYRNEEAGVVAALGAAAGFNAVILLALYISSSSAQELYRRPEILWLICPLLVYWLARVLLLARRRMMDDDPVLFAVRDRATHLAAAAVAAVAVAAV